MNSVEYLEAIREHQETERGKPVSNYRLAKLLGISEPRLHNYLGGRPLSPDLAVKVGELSDNHPLVVLADITVERTKMGGMREILGQYADGLRVLADVCKAEGSTLEEYARQAKRKGHLRVVESIAAATISYELLQGMTAGSAAYAQLESILCILCQIQEDERAAIEAQLRELGIDVEVRLARDFHVALAEAERLTGGRRRHFERKPGGERPYDKLDAQKSLELDTAA